MKFFNSGIEFGKTISWSKSGGQSSETICCCNVPSSNVQIDEGCFWLGHLFYCIKSWAIGVISIVTVTGRIRTFISTANSSIIRVPPVSELCGFRLTSSIHIYDASAKFITTLNIEILNLHPSTAIVSLSKKRSRSDIITPTRTSWISTSIHG